MTKRSAWIFLGFSLAAYAATASVGFAAPFLRHGDSAGTQYGKHAKNFLWHGWAKTRGIMLDTSGRRLDFYRRYQEQFYSDHPPLPAWTLAGLFAILGPHEWVVRLQGHLFALGCLVLFFFLVRKWYSGRTSVPATALLALLPMFAYFSSVIVHQVPTLFFILAGLLAYSHRKWGLLVLFQFLACYSDWPGYYLAVVVFVHLGFVERRWKIAWIFPVLNVAIFGLYLLHLYAADPNGLAPMQRLWEVARSRSSPAPLGKYLRSEAMEAARYFTIAGLAGATGWTISKLRAREPGDRFVLCLPLLALDEVWLQWICYPHDYYFYYLGPFIALATARALLVLLESKRSWRVVPATLIVAALLVQSAVILYRRKTTPTHHEVAYRFGMALREVVGPDERTLSLHYSTPLHTPFYSERYVEEFWRTGFLQPDCVGRPRPMTLEDLLESLRTNPERYDWVVAAEREEITAAIDYFRTMRTAMTPEAFDREMRCNGIEIAPSPVLDRLNRIALDRVDRGGFIFYRMRRP